MMCNAKGCPAHMVAFWLMWIGAVNWGLVGLGAFLGSNLNLVNLLVGRWPTVESIVYVLVGVSAVMMLMQGKCGPCKCEVKKA
ncbi:MAG: DUF378 domain-containing protein [Candidatus Uhrbacteria bacterium]